MGVQQISSIPHEQREVLLNAYRHAIATTFMTGAGVAALAFGIVLFLPERPLRATTAAHPAAERAGY
jgi:hypothetical protein